MKYLSKNVAFILSLLIGLLLLTSCEKKSSTNVAASTSTTSSTGVTIAYVNTDTLNEQYGYYVSARENLAAKEQKATKDLEKKSIALQNDFLAFQQKAQKGELTANQVAQREQKFAKRQENLAREQQTIGLQLQTETQEVMDTISNRLRRASQEIANSKGYSYVLNYSEIGSVIIVAPKGDDITNEVLAILNAEIKD